MEIDDLFPVRVGKDYIENIDTENLIQTCDKIRELDLLGHGKSLHKFHLGYTSYFTWEKIHEKTDKEPFNAFQSVFDEIINRSQQYAQVLLEDELHNRQERRVKCETFFHSSWINIGEQYNYHSVHNHANSFIAGCLYLNDVSSITLFNFNQYQQQSISYPCRAGLLLMWPAWVYHQAEQIMGKEKKYGITFNIGVDQWGTNE